MEVLIGKSPINGVISVAMFDHQRVDVFFPWFRPWHVSPEECVQALNEIHAAQSREDLSAEAKLKQLVHELDPLVLILFSR